jgi:hypothetical protein
MDVINSEPTPSLPLLRIEPSHRWPSIDFRELWEYRELLYFLTWRDIKIRYKQTVLGAAWAIIQPVFMMIVFSLFFGKLAKVPSDGIPYPVFAFCALLPWQLFASAVSDSSNSLVGNQGLITKVYFPRLVIPVSAVLSGLLDFFVAFVVLVGLNLLVWHYSRVGNYRGSRIHIAGDGHCVGRRSLAVRAECSISRRAIRDWVSRSVLVIRNSSCLSEQHHPRTVARRICVESDGWSC